MLLGSGLVQGWLLRHGHRQELGVHFMGLGLGVAVSALGAMGMQALHFDWAAQWWGASRCWLGIFAAGLGLWPPVPLPVLARAIEAPPRRWMY